MMNQNEVSLKLCYEPQESHPGVKEHKPQILNAPSRVLICALDIHQEQSQHIYNSQHSCQKRGMPLQFSFSLELPSSDW